MDIFDQNPPDETTEDKRKPPKPRRVPVKDSPPVPADQLSQWARLGSAPLPGGQQSPTSQDFDHARPFARGPPIDALDIHRVISEAAAAHLQGVSPDTLKRMSARGEGPRRIKLSPRRIGYRLSDCLTFLKTRELAASA